MNSVGLRKKFMDEMAEDLLDQYMQVVKGEGRFRSTNATARVEMWDLLKHAIRSTKDAQKYEAENTQEVLKAIREGTMSVEQGREMLEVLQLQKKVDKEEDQDLLRVLKNMGVSFHTVEEPEVEVKNNLPPPATEIDIVKETKEPWE